MIASRGSRSAEPVLGLALGGGGMRGWAHVGVLSVLEERGLRPDLVVGSSAGALIGAYYAKGLPVPEMVRLMRGQRTASLFGLRLDGAALLDTDDLRDLLVEQLGDVQIEDLELPFAVVATELASGKEVVIDRGPVVDAILASSAMPGIFAPVRRGDRLLVDGGICNNVPTSVLVSRGARYTIAVRLHRDEERFDGVPSSPERSVSNSLWADRLAKTIRRDPSLPSGFEVISRVMELTVAKLERYRLQAYPPDVLIRPEVGHVRTLAFSEEREDIYEAGREAALAGGDLLDRLAGRVAAARG